MKYGITALGEILIDFTPAGTDSAGDIRFTRKAGGAPLNLLATVARTGERTAFIGKIGNDMFGKFLRETVKKCGISDEGLITDELHNTTLAFVALDKNGDRDFSFYRNFGADVFLCKDDINTELIEGSRIFHFGSLSLTDEPARSATEYAIDTARRAGCIITYDPNFREPLWRSRGEAVEMMKKPLESVDILKIAKDELAMLFGADERRAAECVFERGVKLILVTDGANGASLYMNDTHISLPAAKTKTVDTTGAGDIFFGTFLGEWLKNGSTLENINAETAKKYLEMYDELC